MSQRGWAAAGKLLVAIVVLGVVIMAAALLVIIRDGVSARTPPTVPESMIALTARHLAVPMAARATRNPIPPTEAALAEGRAHFADHCAGCHANDGSGKTEIGEGLYPKAPDMRSARTQDLTDGEIFYIIRNGVRLTGMPAWGDEHDAADNWKLVHFIRHLPTITAAEVEEMQRMNPISEHERQEQKEDQEFLKGDHKNEAH
jgi:mono/diheme cytochrome c family protein